MTNNIKIQITNLGKAFLSMTQNQDSSKEKINKLNKWHQKSIKTEHDK